MLILLVGGGRRPIWRSGNHFTERMQDDRSAMHLRDAAIGGMGADLHLRAVDPHPVDVCGVPQPRRIAVLGGVGNDADVDAAADGADHGIREHMVCDPENDRIDLPTRRLRVDPALRAIGEILKRHEVHRGIDGIERIPSRRRAGDVGVILIHRRVHPQIIEAAPEWIRQAIVVGKKDRLVEEIGGRIRHELQRGVVRFAEFHDILSVEQHHLEMQNLDGVRGIGNLFPHRDARVFQKLQHCGVRRFAAVGALVNEDADRQVRIRLVPVDERGRVALVFHEPECDVDSDLFVLDQADDWIAAVGHLNPTNHLRRQLRIAESLLDNLRCGTKGQAEQRETRQGQ